MLKLYVVVYLLGKAINVSEPYSDRLECESKAKSTYNMIVTKAKSQNVTMVLVDGKPAYEKDLVVTCKTAFKPPIVTASVTQ